jgi:hypothetical protein
MNELEYRNYPGLNNSALSKLEAELSPEDSFEFSNALKMGSLIDALLTNHTKIDFIRMQCGQYSYSNLDMIPARGY